MSLNLPKIALVKMPFKAATSLFCSTIRLCVRGHYTPTTSSALKKMNLYGKLSLASYLQRTKGHSALSSCDVFPLSMPLVHTKEKELSV